MTEAAHDQRSGWRLVDVIVVIIILMVVAAIVLPGLQQARTGGGRVNECQNNLHNLAVAIEAYTTAHNGRLPPLDSEGPNSSWVRSLLPELGRPDLDKALGSGDASEIAKAHEAVVTIIQCPLDSSNFYAPGRVSYAANMGLIHKSVFNQRNAQTNGPLDEHWSPEMITAAGVFQRGRSQTKNSLLAGDGLAQTIFLIENAQPRKWHAKTNADLAFGMSFEFGGRRDSLRLREGVLARPDSFPISSGEFGKVRADQCTPRPVSPHDGFILASMGDGSCRSLNLKIDPDVYYRLITSNGHQYRQQSVPDDGF